MATVVAETFSSLESELVRGRQLKGMCVILSTLLIDHRTNQAILLQEVIVFYYNKIYEIYK